MRPLPLRQRRPAITYVITPKEFRTGVVIQREPGMIQHLIDYPEA